MRNQALSANDDAFSRMAGAIGAVRRVVGEDALAARVRPSTRRPGQVASEEAPAAEIGGVAAAEGVSPA